MCVCILCLRSNFPSYTIEVKVAIFLFGFVLTITVTLPSFCDEIEPFTESGWRAIRFFPPPCPRFRGNETKGGSKMATATWQELNCQLIEAAIFFEKIQNFNFLRYLSRVSQSFPFILKELIDNRLLLTIGGDYITDVNLRFSLNLCVCVCSPFLVMGFKKLPKPVEPDVPLRVVTVGEVFRWKFLFSSSKNEFFLKPKWRNSTRHNFLFFFSIME